MTDYNINDKDEIVAELSDKDELSAVLTDASSINSIIPQIIPQGLLDRWALTYNPLVLLGLDEDSGTVFADSSGNGNNAYAAEDTGQLTLGVDGPFDNDKKAVDFAPVRNATGRVQWSPYPADGTQGENTFTVAYFFDSTVRGSRLFSQFGGYNGDSNNVIIGVEAGSPEGIRFYHGSWINTGRNVYLGAHLHSFRISASTGLVTFYENGLPFSENGWDGFPLPSNVETALGADNDGDSAYFEGDISLFMHVESSLPSGDLYQQAVDVGGAVPEDGHYYKSTIIDDLGLATLGQQGDVVCHLPLWETAGDQAVDVSMRENHADFVGGPTLGQDPPPDSGLLYSVGTSTGAYMEITGGLGFNPSIINWTMWLQIKPQDILSNRAIFHVGDGTAFFELAHRDGPDDDLFVRAADGSNTIQSVAPTQLSLGWEKVGLRCDATAKTLEIIQNGTIVDVLDWSSLTMPDLSAATYYYGHSPAGWGDFIGHLAGPSIISKKLTDADISEI